MINREQLILDQMSQVRLLATRLYRRCPSCVELDDLVSAGTIGLIQAVDRFDPERGFKLKTLAEHRIRGAILDFLRKLDPLPRAIRLFVRERDELVIRLNGSLGRAPEDSELAQALGITIERYRRFVWTVRASQTRSLEEVRDR